MLALVEPIKSPKPIHQLQSEITQLAGQINAATYRFLKLIAEFDLREGWHEGGTQSCAHWLNWKVGLSLNAAREKLRVAHSLEKMPLVSKAFSEGKLSYSKVRAISRLVNEESDEYLLMIAEHGTASQLEKLIRLTRRCISFNQPEPEVSRKVTSYQDEEGMWVINARLPAETGELVVKAIESIFERMQTEDVSAETSISKWAGEQMDYQLSVGHLLNFIE